MKLPERNDRYLISTMTATGLLVLAGVIWGDVNAWWTALAVFCLFLGHSQEYKDMFLWRK